MNPHDDKPDDPKDDEQIASVLKASETDAPAPEAEALARLRARSSEAFAGAAAPSPAVVRWRPSRWLAAAAAIAIVCVGLYYWLAPWRSGVAFGQVLDSLEKSETVHVRLTIEDKPVELWHSGKTNKSRWDNLDGKYMISDGSKFWVVNETANEARRTEPPAFAKNPIRHFLKMLGVPEGTPAVLQARPSERIQDAGVDTFVYRMEVPVQKGGKVLLEARVDAKTNRLLGLQAKLNELEKIVPIGDLKVLAVNEPIAVDKFVFADTLTEDGRIGKVTDVQGIVSIKPVMGERWTPVREGLVLKPGDWIRTDARGANATALRLVKSTGVILGPKTLVELIGPKQIRLIEGQVELTAAAGTTVELIGPGKQGVMVKGRQFYRVGHLPRDDKVPPSGSGGNERGPLGLVRVDKDPPWLTGFKGATTNESLGSLVALVDGRNVPLTVGYHKVQVDIRDQIARTVIEESFVNHTKNELEGVFYFPLPPDASISGFGMWIGNNLVEADVVEKQRAREIYETILRERRDPGLLEWSGGNIFKARVFPIPAGGEKRIKISYTQVLPMKGSRYRYSYALQSELLQQNPLRELNIDVKVNSVVPLKSVTSPTHPTRDEKTTHSAHVEFSAQEYTPTRDFEVVIDTEARQSEVVVIPHRRGDDGYFMLQLTPPGSAGDWERPLLPNGDPLRLLIVADTSASIDAGQRATQATFVASLLSSLTPKDTFNLATCDVSCDWAFGAAKPADADNVAAARDFLAKRQSLGWTDLDAAFAGILKQADKHTHVIYVGDGILTTGDADPVAFTKRLRRMVLDFATSDKARELLIDPKADNPHFAGVRFPGGFHAVSLGSSYESVVLKAIASLGGGSVRKITTEQGPTLVARELLGEIAQPALRDIKVEFQGKNLKVARVYPEAVANVPAGSQQILLGRYLPEDKDQSGEVIVTGTQGGKPVKFSTRMTLKDAEQGNSFIPRLWARMHLDFLLEQGASARIKDEIISLSEEYQIITPYTSFLVLETDADRERFKVKRRFQMRDGERFFADGRDNAVFDLAQKQMKKAANWRTAMRRSVLNDLARLGREPRLFQPARHHRSKALAKLSLVDGLYDGDAEWYGVEDKSIYVGQVLINGTVPMSEAASVEDRMLRELDEEGKLEEFAPAQPRLAEAKEDMGLPFPSEKAEKDSAPDHPGGGLEGAYRYEPFAFDEAEKLEALDFKSRDGSYFGRRGRGPQYGSWLNTLFPPLHAAPGKPKETKSTWPAPARDLARSLLRTDKLVKMTGGIEIVRQTDTFDVRWDEVSSRSNELELASPKAWLTRSSSDSGQTIVSWCDAKEIGTYSKAFQLGRVRASTPQDVQPPPLHLSDYSMTSLEQTYSGHVPTLEVKGKDRTLLVLKHGFYLHTETHILIDTARHVILSIEERYKGKVTSATRFDDFVEAAGSWWAQLIEATNDEGKRRSLITLTVKAKTQDEFDKQTAAELAGKAQVQFLRLPAPSVANAKKALATGKASFEDHFVLLWHFMHSQQWARVLDHLDSAEKLAGNKPGLRWVRSALLYDSRRHDGVRQRYQEDAGRIVKGQTEDSYFLAQYIVGQSAQVLQANEMLTLLDSVKPLHDKQPPHVHARKQWLNQRVRYLDQTGQSDEVLRLRKQLATDYPRDYGLQQYYAQALAGAGDYPAAYAWLTRVTVKEAKWLYWEEDYLRTAYADLKRQQGRYDEVVKYLADWMEQNPQGRSAFEQYLSALIRTDQIDKADALALKWLKDAQVPEEWKSPVEGRANAAIYLMLGNGYQLWTNRIEERFLAPLGEAALYFARQEEHRYPAEQILSNHRFRESEESRRVRKKLAGILIAEIDKMPAEQARRFVGWVQQEDAAPADWKKITDVLRARWTKEAKDEEKHTLGQALVGVLSREAESAELLTFLRLQWKTGPESHRDTYAGQLFDQLLAQPWTAEFESEAFAMLDKLSTSEDAGAKLFATVAALHRLTDRLIDNRIAVRAKLLEHPEKLTRTELLKKQEEDRRLAREGVADRLRKEAARHPKALAQWLIAESLYLDILLDRNLKQAAAEAWEVVGAAPAKKNAEDEPSLERSLENVLRQRYFVMLTNLAARKSADPALIDQLRKYIDQGIEIDAPRWRPVKSRLLIALDRPKELETALKQWTREDDPDNRWRVSLGYLLAEQGKLAEAIREFEAVEAADELDPAAYRTLSNWYLAENKREPHERAGLAVYKTTPEHYLYRMIQSKLHPWQQRDGHLPTELDKEVMRMFAVLFDKSSRPENYLYQLQSFYQASRDFRLLAVLPESVIGHSAARVYPFVQGMQPVLNEVRDEATADEIVKRIAEIRPRAKTDVDKRALDMLEALVERRASEVVNQPGPHKDKALAALVRVSKGEWGPGEPRLMADFLASLESMSQPALADEQLRQLKELHAKATPGSIDRLHIAHRYAWALRNHKRAPQAIDLLQTALDEYQAANDGVLPVVANGALDSFIYFLEQAGHFARGEKVLLAQLERPVHAQQKRRLIQNLDRLYYHALQNEGEVSLGKEHKLYLALIAKMQKDITADTDQNHRYELMYALRQVYVTANGLKIPGVADDLRKYAFEIAPPIIKEQTINHESVVSGLAQTLRDVAGPRDAVVFLLNEIEVEPKWLRYMNQDGWSRHGSSLAQWRAEAKDLGKDEARLLKLVLAELRRDLETREYRNRSIYQKHATYFWKEKADDFAKTAEAVLAERNKSGASVQYIADYLYHGLDLHKRAIEILFVAHKEKLLDETGQAKLVGFLHEQKRFAESIPLLAPLVERRQDHLEYRVLLMHAYFRTEQRGELLGLLAKTDAYFHEKDRWSEYAMNGLAFSTLKNELFEKSVAYFKELIPLHERTQPNRGVGNGTLSKYYGGLADAYVGLKKTPEAVDAASAAIVAWGRSTSDRARALETLTRVLVKAPDLDAFVAHVDKQAQETKQDSAIIRKAIGQAYAQKKDHDKAIKQLELAATLQPNDAEIYELLIKSHDKLDDKEGAIRQLFQAVQLSRRDLELYRKLGDRLKEAKQSKDAERAYTSIVEMQPLESESHAMLAEIREKENRWPEAIAHWEQVARIRALEPTGLLKLAAAQIHEKQWDQARATLRKLDTQSWPSRFSDVHRQVEKLRESINDKSPKR